MNPELRLKSTEHIIADKTVALQVDAPERLTRVSIVRMEKDTV